MYSRSDHVEWSISPNGGITVKDLESNWYFPLNPVASLVWDLFDGVTPLSDIVQTICDEFEVNEDTARGDIIDFIEQSLDLNLIEEIKITDSIKT